MYLNIVSKSWLIYYSCQAIYIFYCVALEGLHRKQKHMYYHIAGSQVSNITLTLKCKYLPELTF